jgi:hypothetical protein
LSAKTVAANIQDRTSPEGADSKWIVNRLDARPTSNSIAQ